MTTDAPPATAPTEEDALIEAMIADGMPGLEPGSVHAKDVLHRGDAEAPAPVVVGGVQSAGYVTIYNVRTGEPSNCNRNMLRSMLRERFRDGALERVFTVYDPHFRPFKGNVKCFLHADEPRRAEFDALGLPTCPAAGLANDHQRELHMRHRHKTSWETIERMRTQEEKDEDRRWQREMLGLAAGRQPAVVEEPVAEATSSDFTEATSGYTDTLRPASVEAIVPITADDGRPKFACRAPDCTWEPKKNSQRPRRALNDHREIMHGLPRDA